MATNPDRKGFSVLLLHYQGRFPLIHWKENSGDDNERILGLMHMRNDRDFLVNSDSDPETYRFRGSRQTSS